MKTTIRNKVLAVFIVLTMILGIIPPIALPVKAAVWNGTPDTSWHTGSSPYTITTAEQLAGLAVLSQSNTFSGETINLGADIVLNDTSNFANWASSPPANEWTPIGTSESRFSGTFNGNGHTISGLYISKPSEDYKGLFMYTSGVIRNLTLTDCYIYANRYAGGISYYCGTIAEIINCSVSGVIRVIDSYAGGIVGKSENGTIIKKCINNASVTAGRTVGGIIGVNAGMISDCYNTGNITGTDTPYSDASGIAGNNNVTSSIIANCYNLGNISGIDTAGGITAYNVGTITNCYSAATLSGTNIKGLVTETASSGSMSYSYWNSTLYSGSGYDTGSSCFPKTTAEMQAESFVTLLNANKGMHSSWVAVSGDYPTFGASVPSVTLSVNNSSIAEAAGVATVTATLSAAITENVTVNLSYTGTATGSGTDYTASAAAITIAAGNTTGTATITAVQDTIDEVNETVIVDITSITNGTESGTQQVTVTITDDDAEPSLSVNDPSVTEGNSGTTTISFTVTLSAESGRTVTVDYASANGTAIAGTDYTTTSGTLTFNPGETTKTVSVTVNGDTVTEGDETVLLNLTNPSYAIISDALGVGTIIDDDAPLVTLSVNNSSIAEAAGVATITATLSAATTDTVTVTLGFTGAATGSSTDYTASSSTITITAGNTTETMTITSVQDILDEDDETVVVDIASVTNATESGTQQVTVTITDDDAEPSLSVNDTSVTEGNSGTTAISFTVTLSAESGKTVTVDYATANGTAIVGTDYTATSGTLTFNPGETTKTVSVTVIGDTITESNETVFLNLSNVNNATISDSQGTGTITNDDAAPAITINDVTVNEGNSGTSTMTFAVLLDHASAFSVSVNYASADSTATAGDDYVATSGILTFAAGETSKTITVTINGDTNYEPTENFNIDLSGESNATISDNRGVGTITNDDAAPLVTLSGNSSIAEAAGVATVTATLSATTTETVTVNLGYTGTATGAGTDYTASATTITITAGNTTGTATITAVQDIIDEADETVVVDITGVTNATESGTQQVTVTITDDDAEPSLSINDLSVAEGDSGTIAMSFTVTLSAESGKTVTVDYASANGTAIAGTDYTATSGTLTFNPGETTKTVSVIVNGDTITESDETVLMNLSNPGNATISDTQGVGTITNDDAAPAITIDDVTLVEGNSGTSNMTFTVSLDHASSFTVNVNYATADSTATAGNDYIGTSWTLTYAPGETTKTITVIINGDINYEENESYYVNLSSPINATLSDGQGTGTITNDDSLPSVTLSVDNTAIDEAAGVATVTATLSATTTEEVTVTLDFTGTATDGGIDYNASAATITIAAGSTTGTITITAVQDSLDEIDETVVVDITGVTNATESGTQQVTVTITDDDPTPSLSVNNPSVIEGYSGTVTMTFNVTLSEVSGKTVTVDYATADGTATAGTDYTAVNGVFAFDPGQTSKSVNITVMGDDEIEAHETILFSISGAVNATVSDAQGTGIIYDDDEEPETDDSSDAVVEVNGEKQDAGQSSTKIIDNKKTTTITVDDKKLNDILEQRGNDAVVTLPVDTDSDVVIGELNGQTVKNMENKVATLEIKTDNVTYTLPASQINIDSVSAQFGSQVALNEIKVSIKISEPPADTVKIMTDTANEGGYQLVVQPVNFEITCTHEDETVNITSFSGYVERMIAIPDGVDPSKITTGIVLNSDGTFRHVPTTILLIEGRYYAKINSLTNSTYSIIYNYVEFSDVLNHWAKDAINDMASRMVVEGNENNVYKPDDKMTRADFAMVIVNALGLEKGTGDNPYRDVKETDWFSGFVETATAYSLIKGYDSTHYGPNDSISREQAMTIITRAMKLTGLEVSLTESEVNSILAKYIDGSNVSAYARESVAACIKAGIITGTSTTTLSPKAFTSRAETAVMVQRLLRKSGLIN